MIEITADILRETAGGKSKDSIVVPLAPAMNDIFPEYEITTRNRIAHFLAQTCHESAHFCTLNEYGGPSYFARYDNRKDLGNTQPGDGNRFHGRGLIQITGRANYTKFGAKIGVDLVNHPELAADPANSIKVACEYWKDRSLNDFADKNDLAMITKRINGGLNGLDDRKACFSRALVALGAEIA